MSYFYDDSQVRVIDEDGSIVDDEKYPEDLSSDELRDMYQEMVVLKEYDDRCVNLQRRGELGTYPELKGHEGSHVGVGFALDNNRDWVIHSYRDQGVQYLHGVSLEEIMLYWKGNVSDQKNKEENVLPPCVPIATQIPHATGMAWASNIKGEDDKVFACFFGDGATSKGDFHEGLNFASVFDTPNLFFCNNNQYAISVPIDKQTGSETLAQKSESYGIPNMRVDGMDPLAVYSTVKLAAEYIREEQKPVFIEAIQYRFGAHTTADDPSVYRDDEEVEEWRAKYPTDRFERHLIRNNVIDEDEVEEFKEEAEKIVDSVVESVKDTKNPEPIEIFDNVYENTPKRIENQFNSLTRGDINE